MRINSISNIKFSFGKVEKNDFKNDDSKNHAQIAPESSELAHAQKMKAEALKCEIAMNDGLLEKVQRAYEMKEDALRAKERADYLTKELNQKIEEALNERKRTMRKQGRPNIVEKSNDEGKPSKLFMYYPNNDLKLAMYYNEDGSYDVIECDKKGNAKYSRNQTRENRGTSPFIYKTLEEIKTTDGELVKYTRNIMDNVYYREVKKDAELINKAPFCLDYSEGIYSLDSQYKVERKTTIYRDETIQTYKEGITSKFPEVKADIELVIENGKVVEYKKRTGDPKNEDW